jgi:hypothetical protein
MPYYDPETGKFNQAHILGGHAIMEVIRQADPTILRINVTNWKNPETNKTEPYFYLEIDRSKMRTVAFPALEEYLRRL